MDVWNPFQIWMKPVLECSVDRPLINGSVDRIIEMNRGINS